MLFTESDLRMTGNPMAILDEAVYLSENESLIRPQTIPVKENTRIGAYTVNFDDIDRLAENYGADYIDAMAAVAEASGIDLEYLKVAVNEADIITDPEIVLALPESSVVIAPLSENSLAFQYVNECISLWDGMPDTDEADMALAEALIDDTYLEQFIQEAEANASGGESLFDKVKGWGTSAKNAIQSGAGKVGDFYTSDFKQGAASLSARNRRMKNMNSDSQPMSDSLKKQLEADNKTDAKNAAKSFAKGTGKVAGTIAVVGGAIALGRKLLGQADNKPKSWIGQKIAALRKVYASWMQKAQKGGPGVGAKIKQAAAKLLQIIDALMAKMQNAAG